MRKLGQSRGFASLFAAILLIVSGLLMLGFVSKLWHNSLFRAPGTVSVGVFAVVNAIDPIKAASFGFE